MGIHWTVIEQFVEFIKGIKVLGFWRCFYCTYLYRWHARLAHRVGWHTWEGLGIKGMPSDNPHGFAPYFERCSWCGEVKEQQQ